jgi:membrane protease subunit HflC
VLRNVGKEAKERYGVDVEFTKIRQLVLPKDITEKVFDRMKKERETLAADIKQAGEEEAKKIRANADSNKTKILAKAKSDAKLLKGQGDAEAAKHYEVFSKDEDLAIFLRELETLRNSLEKRSTVILTTEDGPYRLLRKSWKEKK